MEIFSIFLIVYGVFCIFIGLLKPPFVWNMKKLQIMQKMFGGARNLQIFILVWGIVVLVIGILIKP